MPLLIENNSWRSTRTSFDWLMYPPDTSYVITIKIFDDDNQQYIEYPNIWHKYGECKGKIAIVNAVNANIRIESISIWKTQPHNISEFDNTEKNATSSKWRQLPAKPMRSSLWSIT